MELVKNSVFSVICAALIVAAIMGFTDPKSATGGLIRLVGGVFLAMTLMQNVLRIDYTVFLTGIRAISADAQEITDSGKSSASQMMRRIIKEETEAYILDKAGAFGAEVTVEVTLSTDEIPVPVCVRLQGKVSPFAKQRLQTLIEADLAIAKEDQIWIG